MFLSINAKGHLMFHHDDHSGTWEDSWDDHCHYQVVVHRDDKGKVVSALQSENAMKEDEDVEWALLDSLVERGFRSFRDYMEWLENHTIPFRMFSKVV